MSTTVEAVYEGGMPHLLEPLPLRERTRVSVSVAIPDQTARVEWLAHSERRLRETWDNESDDVCNELLAP